MYKLSHNMSTEKYQAIQKKIIYYKYENMQDCKIVTPESCVRVSCEAWRLLLAGNF